MRESPTASVHQDQRKLERTGLSRLALISSPHSLFLLRLLPSALPETDRIRVHETAERVEFDERPYGDWTGVDDQTQSQETVSV
jgi:hypothetical protein